MSCGTMKSVLTMLIVRVWPALASITVGANLRAGRTGSGGGGTGVGGSGVGVGGGGTRVGGVGVAVGCAATVGAATTTVGTAASAPDCTVGVLAESTLLEEPPQAASATDSIPAEMTAGRSRK